MITVRLETGDGAIVTYATIPPFKPLPDVLTWGTRTFERRGDRPDSGQWCWVEEGTTGCPIYREAFAVAVVDEGTPRSTVVGWRFPGMSEEPAGVSAEQKGEGT